MLRTTCVFCNVLYNCYLYEAAGLPLEGTVRQGSDPYSDFSKLARDIIEKRHTHQKDEQRYANLLAEGLRPFG